MIYKDMEIKGIGYNKVEKAFKVTVAYPLSSGTSIFCFNVKWKDGDNEAIFMERILNGAIAFYNIAGYLAREGLYLYDMIVSATEHKEEYRFSLKIGNGQPNKKSYIFATSNETEDTIRAKVQSIKTSFASTTISEKRRNFLTNFKSFLGI